MSTADLMKLVNFLFWATLLWAIADSVWRWLRLHREPRPIIHAYVPIHYVGGAAGVTLWALNVGNLDYDKAGVEWLRSAAVSLTLAGWGLTLAGRIALGQQWTPDVVAVASQFRIRSGPYALLKHPIYIGETTFFLGISLYLASIPTLVLLFLGGTLYNLYRALSERYNSIE